MRMLLLPLVTIALAGCASVPSREPAAWLSGGQAMAVRWTPGAVVSGGVVHDGVCELRFPDLRHGDVPEVDPLARRCALAGGMQWSGQEGAMHVRWHQVETRAEIEARHRSLYGEPTKVTKGGHGMLAMRARVRPTFSGFYYRDEATGICHIVSGRWANVFAHELKHCRDGDYHL